MAKDLANVRVYGDTDGAVWVAPLGTTMPTDLSDVPAAFGEVGWITEDGVNVSTETENESWTGWQGGKVLRRRITSQEDQFTFQAAEENAVVLGLWIPNANITTTGGVTKIVPPEGIDSDPRAFVLDFHDGDVHKRYNVIRGEVIERGEVPHQNTELTTYQFTVAMTEYEILTNNPALAVAGGGD